MPTKENLLIYIYFNPSKGLLSANKLYEKVKENGLTLKEVKEFVDKQEAQQVLKQVKPVKNYFPITAKYKYQLMQVDVVDVSAISANNNNVKFLLVAVYVFSRMMFVIPLKNKTASTVTNAMEEIINLTKCGKINTDNGSEFISNEFKNMLQKYNVEIQYVDVNDHKKLGIVDRAVRTLRSMIDKYTVAYSTSKYIDVLQDIVSNYNNTYHSTIKKAPIKVKQTDDDVFDITREKYMKAYENQPHFNIGDSVRYKLQRTQFQKGVIRWSKTIHKIVDQTTHSYILDNGKTYKAYDIQLATETPGPKVIKTRSKTNQPTIEQMRRDNTINRRLRTEGVDITNIVKEKRERKPTDRYKT